MAEQFPSPYSCPWSIAPLLSQAWAILLFPANAQVLLSVPPDGNFLQLSTFQVRNKIPRPKIVANEIGENDPEAAPIP